MKRSLLVVVVMIVISFMAKADCEVKPMPVYPEPMNTIR
jgi:hypothetical protein